MVVTTHVWVHYVQIDMCIEQKMEQWILVKISVCQGVQHVCRQTRSISFIIAHERQPLLQKLWRSRHVLYTKARILSVSSEVCSL
jgi:hypothetical protein